MSEYIEINDYIMYKELNDNCNWGCHIKGFLHPVEIKAQICYVADECFLQLLMNMFLIQTRLVCLIFCFGFFCNLHGYNHAFFKDKCIFRMNQVMVYIPRLYFRSFSDNMVMCKCV